MSITDNGKGRVKANISFPVVPLGEPARGEADDRRSVPPGAACRHPGLPAHRRALRCSVAPWPLACSLQASRSVIVNQ